MITSINDKNYILFVFPRNTLLQTNKNFSKRQYFCNDKNKKTNTKITKGLDVLQEETVII